MKVSFYDCITQQPLQSTVVFPRVLGTTFKSLLLQWGELFPGVYPLKCYHDQILDYHLFSLDWQFSTWSTWCANYSFIWLRKVVFFCAQKPLIFVGHYNTMFLWPGYQEHKTIALWCHFLNTVYTAWQISWKNPAQTMFPFLSLQCILV